MSPISIDIASASSSSSNITSSTKSTLPAPPDYTSIPSNKIANRSRSRSLETIPALEEEEDDPRLIRSLNPDSLVKLRSASPSRPRSSTRPESGMTQASLTESDASSVVASQGTPSSSPKSSPKKTSPRSQSLRVRKSSHRRSLSDHNRQLELDPSLPGNSTV